MPTTRTSIESLISNDTYLPAPSSALTVLLAAFADEDIEYEQLAEAINRFPTIAVRLLSLANSAWSAPRVTITSVERACAHLGLTLTRSVSISLAIAAPFNPMRCSAFDLARFWYNAFSVAAGAELLGKRIESITTFEPKTLHTAGLLHNLGLLWLADRLPSDLQRALTLVAGNKAPSVNEALRQVSGIDIHDVSGRLARVWKLPNVFISAMEHHANPDYSGDEWEAVALIRAATDMVSALPQGLDRPTEMPLLDRLGIASSERQKVFEAMQEQSERTRELATALCRL